MCRFAAPVKCKCMMEDDQSNESAMLDEEESLLVTNRLHQVLRPFMLRRLKESVAKELPQKVRFRLALLPHCLGRPCPAHPALHLLSPALAASGWCSLNSDASQSLRSAPLQHHSTVFAAAPNPACHELSQKLSIKTDSH